MLYPGVRHETQAQTGLSKWSDSDVKGKNISLDHHLAGQQGRDCFGRRQTNRSQASIVTKKRCADQAVRITALLLA